MMMMRMIVVIVVDAVVIITANVVVMMMIETRNGRHSDLVAVSRGGLEVGRMMLRYD